MQCTYFLQKRSDDVTPQHIFSITPEAENIICTKAFSKIGENFQSFDLQ